MGCSSSSSADTKGQQKPSELVEMPSPSEPATVPTKVVSPPAPAMSSNPVQVSPPLSTTEPTLEGSKPSSVQHACFGAGCYWGTEKYFRYAFPEKYPQRGKIIAGEVGFMGPENAPANPVYRDVCSGKTGHVEVYHFTFEGGPEYFEDLCRFYFQFHDPTSRDRQGNDRGTQYASVIFCYNQQQQQIAEKVRAELQAHLDCGNLKCYSSKVVCTDLRDATVFYAAHEEHQDYLTANPNGYCNHRMRFKEWPQPVE